MKTDRPIQIAEIVGGGGYTTFEAYNRVYSIEGISPTLITRYQADWITGFKIAYEQERIKDTTEKQK